MELFDDATMLNKEDFFVNEFGMAIGSLSKGAAKDYYINICALINENYAGGITPQEIERRLDTDARKYLFLTAQAKQLLYDRASGRGSMLRGEDKAFDTCGDTVARLKMLGLWRPIMEL